MTRGVALAALLLAVVTPSPALAAGPPPLEQARHAAEHTAFEGVLVVRWRDGDVTHSERLTVAAAGGSLMVTGANLVMARPEHGRLLAHAGGGWEEMWLPSRAPSARPDGNPKYVTSAQSNGPMVAGRTTKVVEVYHKGSLLERIYLDSQTDLLLERDQFDARGDVVRQLAFESLKVDGSTAAPTEPRAPAHHAPKSVAPDRLESSEAPVALADGYERMGVYRSGRVLQVLYSDGVYDLSLFQQEGRLRRSDVPPSGERVTVGTATGWRYPWPGGQLVMWSAGGKVFTAVSDAPADQVVAAVRSLPPTPGRELSLLGKIKRACEALMQPLS